MRTAERTDLPSIGRGCTADIRGKGNLSRNNKQLQDLNDAREELDRTKALAFSIGIHPDELMKMDIRTFKMLVEGSIEARQTKIDDSIMFATVAGLKAALYNNGSSDASKPIDIKLREETREEKIRKTLISLNAAMDEEEKTNG